MCSLKNLDRILFSQCGSSVPLHDLSEAWCSKHPNSITRSITHSITHSTTLCTSSRKRFFNLSPIWKQSIWLPRSWLLYRFCTTDSSSNADSSVRYVRRWRLHSKKQIPKIHNYMRFETCLIARPLNISIFVHFIHSDSWFSWFGEELLKKIGWWRIGEELWRIRSSLGTLIAIRLIGSHFNQNLH